MHVRQAVKSQRWDANKNKPHFSNGTLSAPKPSQQYIVALELCAVECQMRRIEHLSTLNRCKIHLIIMLSLYESLYCPPGILRWNVVISVKIDSDMQQQR
ncbi:conserved hypothetical protein [Trichinella spiralis]|uniref:hypothetical protein n=1 Tax=Trichinella spiralis TaxID=6334 RepID=UPI0001EFE921|nr:conserved hypothetical protein [Trichinella spiralis]